MTQQPELALRGDVPAEEIENKILRYSVSLVTQGSHRFYTLTIPSDILAKTCYVTTREEDPVKGFQRVLDRERAQQIADYIDSGLGTIPNSIVLSAQPEAELRDVGKGKTLEFRATPKSFLVIDGQHRVYGFSLANTRLRVPVVIYNNLSKRDESRLFIDINTKQKPVPSELLLDIKQLAEYESDAEQLFREVYDQFHADPASPLFGLTSPAARAGGKISRVTFNAALKPLLPVFGAADADKIYMVLSDYVRAFKAGCSNNGVASAITNPTILRAAFQLFPEVGERLKSRNLPYTSRNFEDALAPVFSRVSSKLFTRPPRSAAELFEVFSKALRQNFTI